MFGNIIPDIDLIPLAEFMIYHGEFWEEEERRYYYECERREYERQLEEEQWYRENHER